MKSMRLFTYLLLFLLPFSLSYSQDVTIPIETENTVMVLKTDHNNRLKIIYFGKSLSNIDEYKQTGDVFNFQDEGASSNNSAYAVAGIDNNFIEPAIAVIHTDGNNSLDLLYESHTATQTDDGATLTTITLKDPVYPFFVDLLYKTWNENDVIEQWTVIRHTEKGKVVLNKYASANLYLNNTDYYLTSYNGSWAKEMQPEETHLRQGMHTIESRLGTRANLLTSPNFMLSLDGKATETSGTIMMGQIAWNGNFSLQFETDMYKNLHVVAGINPYQSAYHLDPNTPFETPRFIYTLSFEGKGKGSRNLHDWLRDHILLDGHGDRLTLLNNWEATYFDFDQDKLVSLFGGAKELGVDMFLLDDGWFANKYPRNGDTAGLGDWEVNRKKLPDGVPFLVREAEKEGVKFGIWIEPEMVNPKSELYEKHPDWVIKEEKRPEIYFRNQLVLDLANPEVQEFVFEVVDDLFTENPTLAFIKWDCNAPIFNGHSKYLEREKIPQSHLYVAYSKGLQNVLERIRTKYPTVPMMLCSGGGGRSDYNLLKYFTEFWLSDNTDPLERVFMQWNYSYYYPAIAMCNHVTDWSKDKSLKYRIDVASMGKLGFDIRANELSEQDMRFAQQTIVNYDDFKEIIWHGEMYRLANPYEKDLASLMYVNEQKTEGVMFNYLTNWRYLAETSLRPILLQGLDKNKTYRLTEINLYDGAYTPINDQKVYSGEFLMNVGFNPSVNSSRSSVIIKIESIE
ncbi:MAG: alpha-galactosidase [Fermentimonas sp.]|nr:alpha-galactosidase [Fermentimonas sp.]MDD3901978.1 alpha-galactosidase [Dysgonamonadaceae bacterium]MDD4698512.1 alpha-galactosidase [Fermentimonas sp.]